VAIGITLSADVVVLLHFCLNSGYNKLVFFFTLNNRTWLSDAC